MSDAQLCLTKLKKVGRADKQTQNRSQVRFGRLPKATYRLEVRHSRRVIFSKLTPLIVQTLVGSHNQRLKQFGKSPK